MPMYGMPAGLVGLMGAGAGGGGGFLGAFGGGLNAFGQAEQAQAQRSDNDMQGMLQIARMQEQIRNARLQQQQQQQAQGQALAQQGQAEELRAQLPEGLRELFDVDQDTAIARAFPEARAPQRPTSLMQNLSAAGLQPGTPEYEQAVMQAVTKPQVQLKQEGSIPAGHRAIRNEAGQIVALEALAGGPADPTRPTTEQRNKLATAQKTHSQLTGQIADYAKTLQAGVANLPGKARDRVKTQREQIKLQLKNLYELGAITGPDEEILNNLILDPTSLSGRAAGLLPGVDSPEQRAIENLGILMQEADRALSAAQGNNPKAQQAPAAPTNQSSNPADYSLEELERIANGG